MIRLAASPARPVAFLASLVWLWTVIVGQIHDLRVLHVVCPEHHEVIELHPSAVADDGHHRAELTAGASAHAHDHGCVIGSFPSLGTPTGPAVVRLALRVRPIGEPVPVSPPARGPPLDYAPKTSPPSVS
jgi:hypothetical protein